MRVRNNWDAFRGGISPRIYWTRFNCLLGLLQWFSTKFPPRRNASSTHWEEGRLQNIYRKTATSTLNAMYLLLWLHLCGVDLWTVFPRRSQLREKLKRKFDETNTQVVAWMTNKCKGRMVQGGLYNRKYLP